MKNNLGQYDRLELQRQVAKSLPFILQFPNKDLIQILEKVTMLMSCKKLQDNNNL